MGLAEALVVLGAVTIAVSIVLHWIDLSHNFGGTQITRRVTASGIPVQVLWDYTTKSTSPSLLVVLVPVAVLCLLGFILPRSQWLAAIGGTVALIVGLLFIFQAHQELRAEHVPGIGLTDFIGIASYVCIVGGALAVLGGALALRPRRASA